MLSSFVSSRSLRVFRRLSNLNTRSLSADSEYVTEMYNSWNKDPSSVHPDWAAYFATSQTNAAPTSTSAAATSDEARALKDTQRLVHLLHSYQTLGHSNALNVDPLGLSNAPEISEDLLPAAHGFDDADMDRTLDLAGLELAEGMFPSRHVTLRQFVDRLQSIYCDSIGAQFHHLRDAERVAFVRQRIQAGLPQYSPAEREQMLERLAYAAQLETFLAFKFNTVKRFGLEGCEGMIPGLKALLDTATAGGVQDVVIGMAHRGRLAVLANVIRKPLETILREFQGLGVDVEGREKEDWSTSGDVKYHLGTSYKRMYPDGRQVRLSLLPNPSHLEAVNPVVVGKARAKAYFSGDEDHTRTLPILIHGDAAFSGQGVVYETLQFSHLRDYGTGGCIHVVCNNQIGFTTNPISSRSSQYSSDVGLAFGTPIFHVNGDDLEAVTHVFRLAAEYRQKFKDDVIVDLVGYRKHGHNELDQPLFTQPQMYKTIAAKAPPLQVYSEKLIREGHMTAEAVAEVVARVNSKYEEAFENTRDFEPGPTTCAERWGGVRSPLSVSGQQETAVALDRLTHAANALYSFPPGFTLHRQLQKVMAGKVAALEQGMVDWGTAEALAFATLLQDGVHVRLSGQDVERGTFSHRHAVLHDQNTGERYQPLTAVPGATETAHICNSALSEFATLGYEFGYSLESPDSLVLWEAQFGDFVNGAQVMIDQFISSSESKWLRQSGLVMLLPHGYDGQGAEHSSCRIERFLQQCDEDPDEVPALETQQQLSNWSIINCTTPANYYHALRRQCAGEFRKPLIVMSPKNLLRHKHCISPLTDMAENTAFQRVISEANPNVEPAKTRRLILCTGKVYYELAAARDAEGANDVAIVRVEQLCPFPFDLVAAEIARYSDAEVVWVQEEPKNMGAWIFVQDRIMTASRVINKKEARAGYVGRATQASPAVGYGAVHTREQEDIIRTALSTEVHTYSHGIGVAPPPGSQ